MNVPEGFKQTEVGVIPKDWKVTQLSDLSSMKSGEAITSKNIHNADKYPCFGGNGLRGYTSSYTHRGDFALIGRQGALCGNVQFVAGDFFASEHAVVVTPKEQTDIKWLYYILLAMNLNQYAESSAQPGLSVEKINKLPLPLPPTRAEQTAIAAALSDMDALIEGVKKLLEKKRRIKQGAMQELLTGKRRVSGFESQAGFQQTEVGVIPKDWEVIQLNSAGIFFKGGNIPKSELKFEGIPCVLYGEIYTKYNCIEYTIYSRTSEKVANNAFELKKGDVLFAGSGETAEEIGKCFSYQGNERAVAGGDIIILRPNSNFCSSYLGYILNSPSSVAQKYFMGQGSSVFHIYPNSLKKLKIPIPCTFDEQSAIAAILSDMDSEIEQLETQLAKYRQLKTGMMQELLTGKKRLV